MNTARLHDVLLADRPSPSTLATRIGDLPPITISTNSPTAMSERSYLRGHRVQGRASTGRRVGQLAVVVVATALTVTACGRGRPPAPPVATAPSVEAPMTVVGRITRTVGKDTVPVGGAFVRISDLSLTTQSDSSGNYTFSAGLVPGKYRVSVEFDGQKGGTATAVPIVVGKTVSVPLHLGGTTAWPPPIALDTMVRKPKSVQGAPPRGGV